jgi:hypothetical protein
VHPVSKERASDDLQRGRRSSLPMRTTALRCALAVFLVGLAIAAPDVAWLLSVGFPNTSVTRHAGMKLTHPAVFRVSNTIARSLSAVALFRRRDVQYRKAELELLQRRYAELERRRHRSKWPQRRHPLRYLLAQPNYLAALSMDGAAKDIDFSGLEASDVAAAATDQPSSIFSDSATCFGATQSGSASNGSAPADVGTDSLTLSGGSIPDTSKVTVDAGGTLQLFSRPDWSFNAKFDGEFAPNTSKAAAGGTLELFSTPNWSLTAKFDGEFAPQPQLYAGSGTLRYTW